MIRINLKNKDNADTVHAVLRMNAADYKALREFMHTEEDAQVFFPHGVKIVVRGRGWYHLVAGNEYRIFEKLSFAIKLIKRHIADEERKVAEQIKQFVPIVMNPGLKLAAYSTAHSAGDRLYIGTPLPQQRVAPSQNKLNALVAKFSHQHKS